MKQKQEVLQSYYRIPQTYIFPKRTICEFAQLSSFHYPLLKGDSAVNGIVCRHK